MPFFLIAALVLAILTSIFALQNAVSVTVMFLLWKFEGSLALVLLLTFILGGIASLLLSVPAMIKSRRTISSQKKKIEELERGSQERMAPH
jgi:uncharacterized integral membrane protein